MPTSADYQAAVEKVVTNSGLLDDFIHGPVGAVVNTDNGPIPTLAEKLDQIDDAVASETISSFPGLQDALNAKANLSHTHTIANITGLQAILDDLEAGGGGTTGAASDISINDGASGTKYANVQAYRDYLLSNAGASQIGWRRTGTTTDRALAAVLEGLAVTPEDFSAVALEDGATSTTSQTTALTAALNSGRLVDCRGKSYNIGTPLAPTGTVRGIINGNFAWTNTTAMQGQQYMLSIIDKDDVRVEANTFNLGTVENCGSNDDSGRGAIKISSSNEGVTLIKRPVVERNRVTGAGNGTSIYVRSASSPRVNYNMIHDRVVAGTASNDAQNGIDLSRSSDAQCEGNIVNGLYYRVSGNLTRIYSRGIVAVEVTGGSYSRNFVSNVDQGMDFSGGIVSGFPNGNTAIACNGNVVHDTRTWGIKFANSIRNSVCVGNVIRNFGWGGIVVSGQSAAWLEGAESKATSHLLITGNYIFDPSDYNSRTDCIGIWIIFRATYPGYPVYIRVIGNTICNTTGNGRLLHGIAQDDGDGAHNIVAGAPYNEVAGNTVIGQTSTPTHGCVPSGVCALTGASSQSIANSTWTAVAWGTETIDGQGMHSVSNNPELIYPNGAGWYEVNFSLVFAENSTGNRQARLLRSGGSVPGGEYATVALNGANTTLSGRCIMYLTAAQNVRVEVYQTSGGALNVNRPNSQFYARRIEQM